MKALVVYESMFGNTEEVARAVALGLEETTDVDIHEVSTAPSQVTAAVDLVAVGGPTHAFSLSRPSTRADAIEKGATHGERDLGVREWLTGLRGGRHAELLAAFESFYVCDIPGPLLSGELDRATAWGRRLASDVSTRASRRTTRQRAERSSHE